eukprot:scaffold11655_cov121-Isochrysis_galbana.AAC.7
MAYSSNSTLQKRWRALLWPSCCLGRSDVPEEIDGPRTADGGILVCLEVTIREASHAHKDSVFISLNEMRQ